MIHALILRELRVASRQRIQYWIRVAGAAAALYALFAVWNQGILGPLSSGRGVFRGLNWLLAGVIWIVAPVMTADCLSREQREVTLPLLRSALGFGDLAGYWSAVAGGLFLVCQFINVWGSWIYAERQLITRRFAIP